MSSNVLQLSRPQTGPEFAIAGKIANAKKLLSIVSGEKLGKTVLVTLAGATVAGLLFGTYHFIFSPLMNLINLFTGAWLIALVLEPVVRRLVTWGVPKVLAIILTFVGTIAGLAGLIALIVKELFDLVNEKLHGSTGGIKTNINHLLQTVGINNFDFGQVEAEINKTINNLMSNPAGLAYTAVYAIVQVILIAVISFTLLACKDYSGQKKATCRSMMQFMPPIFRRFWEFGWKAIEKSFRNYLLGRVQIGLLYGAIAWVVMLVAGIDCPVATACLCALVLVIPVVGAPISLFLPVAIALIGDGKPVLIVLLVLFVIQTLLLNAVLPHWLKRSSESGPVLTLFILLAGAQLGGLFGIMVSVPLAGALKKIAMAAFRLHAQTKRSY